MTQPKVRGPGELFPGSHLPAVNSAMCPTCETDVTELFKASMEDVAKRVEAGEPFPVVGSSTCPKCGRLLYVRARDPEKLSEAEKTQFKQDFPFAPETREL